MVRETHSARQTEELGAALAGSLAPGAVVLVRGEIGSGKTTFVRGACRALGVRGPVTSPTFTIGRRYAGRLPVSHLDLHRLDDPGAEDPGLLADYLSDDSVAFVEWPPSGGELGPATADVLLEHLGGNRRRVTVA